ncbi:HPr family phosphocarrier protein [Faecalicatena sp. Marseille-Q4148]|nr:HPr family phosphocarrier protein [Faecalicatena sp. Marseille-Q4148]
MDIKKRIRLTPNDVDEFVKAAGQCDFDVDVFYNRVIIDAKSILGVLSLDLNQTLTVRYGEKNELFEETLQKFSVA